jgi:peptidoglycan/LPS O-acetylase OafA/YrhL
MAASLGPTWSLSVEEWFYLLWAPVVLHLSRRAIALTSLLVCAFAFVLRWSGGGTSFLTTADVLVTGAILALWFERRTSLGQLTVSRVDKAISGAAMVAAFLWLLLSWLHRDMLSITLLEIATFGAIAWLVRNSGGAQLHLRLLRWKPLAYIGSISYMIYLIHLPVYFLVRRVMEGETPTLPASARTWLVALLSLATTLIFSALSWRWYEGPLLKQKERMTALLCAPVIRVTPVEPAYAHDLPTEQATK